jgi:hypothetical protein
MVVVDLRSNLPVIKILHDDISVSILEDLDGDGAATGQESVDIFKQTKTYLVGVFSPMTTSMLSSEGQSPP